MKRKNRMFLAVLLICINLIPISANAAGPRDGEIVDGSLLTSNKSATSRFDNVMRGAFLSAGMIYLGNEENGVLYVAGETYCYSTCDQVKVNLYLERLEEDGWETLTVNHHTEKNVFYTDKGFYLTFDTGYYYRLSASHIAIKDNESESMVTVTDGIYVE